MNRNHTALWFWLFAVLIFSVGSLNAETMPLPTGNSAVPVIAIIGISGTRTAYGSVAATCAVINPGWSPVDDGLRATTTTATVNAGRCLRGQGTTQYSTVQSWGECPVGALTTGNPSVSPTGCYTLATCPAGWTQSGQTCTRPDCASGYERDASGQCVKNCTAKQGMSLPNSHYQTDSSGGGSFGDCRFKCTKVIDYGINAGGQNGNFAYMGLYYNSTNCTYTGASGQPGDFNSNGSGENPSKNDPKKPSDCMGAGMGYITSTSGKTTCVPSSDAPPDQKPKGTTSNPPPTESGKPGANGQPDPTAPDYKKQESTSTNDGGKVTTKETVTTNPTKDANGNDVCPSGSTLTAGKCVAITVKTQDTNNFCAQNPNDPICEGSGKTPDPCKDNPDRVACLSDSTEGTDSTDPQKSTIGASSISVIGFASSASCPSSIQLPKGSTLSFDWPCQLASGLRPILLALAWLSAGLIVMGAFKNG